MDLGCIDMGCIEKEKQSDEAFLDSETSTNGSGLSNSKNRKIQNKGLTSQMQNKGLTSQMRKNPLRKSSPLNWFPRKKVDSFLKRKIKQLQEVGGMNSTLDETLGDSNPHYSRVLREKIAVSEAAHKAMETRKAAMVEASWCRILRAARIQSTEAESLLLEAEKTAAEAFEAATSIGVIMYDKPDCPWKDSEIETSERSTSALSVTASFEAAFEVDKQVAAAVKSAFVKLASCPSINKDEFKELLRKISEHPDIDEGNQDLSELSSECESDTAAEFDPGFHRDSFSPHDLKLDCEKKVEVARERKYKKKQPFQKLNTTKLVDMMLERLRCLQEDELASLAIIVATCGLNAALAEAENFKQPDLGATSNYTSARALRRISSIGGGARKQFEAELPSLEKFLVKRLTKLEREVLEAKNAKINDNEIEQMEGNIPNSYETRAMKLERSRTHNGAVRNMKQDATDLPSLDKFLVKHVSKLEREVQEAKNRRDFEPTEEGVKNNDFKKKSTSVTPIHIVDESTTPLRCDREQTGKENIDLNRNGDGGLETMKKEPNLISKVEKLGEPMIHMQMILEAPETESLQEGKSESKVIGNSLGTKKLGVSDKGIHRYQKKCGGTTSVEDFESLDKVLVKHVSKLEKEKMVAGSKEELVRVKRRNPNTLSDNNEGSLDQILVKHKSRLEKEKMAAVQQPDDCMTYSVSRREARERELQEAWGGIGLGNSIHPHVSRLERDKACIRPHVSRIEQDKLKRRDPNTESENTEGSLDQILRRDPNTESKNTEGSLDQILRRDPNTETENTEGSLDQILRRDPNTESKNKEGSLDQILRRDPNTESENTEGSLDHILRRDPNTESKNKERSLDQILRRDPNTESENTEGSLDHILRRDPNTESKNTESSLDRSVLKRRDPNIESHNTEGSLDQILVKHTSRLEKEKQAAAAAQQPESQIKHSVSRREARERELQQAWGGLSFGNSLQPHVSRLERDKAAWLKAEEEERRRAMEV